MSGDRLDELRHTVARVDAGVEVRDTVARHDPELTEPGAAIGGHETSPAPR